MNENRKYVEMNEQKKNERKRKFVYQNWKKKILSPFFDADGLEFIWFVFVENKKWWIVL